MSVIVFIPTARGPQVIVDFEDIPVVGGSRVILSRGGAGGGLYPRIFRNGKMLRLHREVVSASANMQVDHINGDTLDCRKCNLRIATPQQNRANSEPNAGKLYPKGVSLQRGRFLAQLGRGEGYPYLGKHESVEAAHEAYCGAAERLHGEFFNPGERPSCKCRFCEDWRIKH